MGKENIFDTMTEKYDAWYDSEDDKLLYESELRCLKPLVPEPETRVPLLEVGVGTGRFAMHFPGAYGVDPAFNALKIAQRRGIKCVEGRGENLPFRDKTFGVVLITFTLCFADDPAAIVKEAGRVLRDDGSIVIGFIPKDSSWGVYYEKKKMEGRPFYGGLNLHTFEGLNKLITENGLKITRIRSTLLQGPAGPAKREEPLEGYVKGAGFVCLKMEKQ